MTDARVAEAEGIEESDVYSWRQELCIILYVLFQFNLKLNVIKDKDLESRAMYKVLKQAAFEKKLLLSFYSTESISNVVNRLVGLKFLIDCYIENNSLEEALLEFRIVDIRDPEFPMRIAEYDKAFRLFFFEEGDSKGFYKLVRTMTWICVARFREVSDPINKALLLIYSADRSKLDKQTRNKYYDIRKVMEWILLQEFNDLEKQSYLHASIYSIKTPGNFDYETFLERLCANGGMPLRLERLIRIMASEKDGQFQIATEWDLDQPHLVKSKKIGYFFAYLENALSSESREFTEIGPLLTQSRNELVDSLSTLTRRSSRKSKTMSEKEL